MEPMDTPDNSSGDSGKSVSTQLSDCPKGGMDSKNLADATDRLNYTRSQDHLEPVREPLRVLYRPTPHHGPTTLYFPAQATSSGGQPSFTGTQAGTLRYSLFQEYVPAQAPSSGLQATNEEVRVHPHGAQSTKFQASFTAAPPTPKFPRLIRPLEAPRIAPRLPELIPTTPGSEFPRVSPQATNEEVRVHPHWAQSTEFQTSFTFAPPTPKFPRLIRPLEAPRIAPRLPELMPTTPGSESRRVSPQATNEEVRVHPHGAQSTEFQTSFTFAPPTPKFPRLIRPLEAPRIAPRLPELMPTTPGSEFPRVSPQATNEEVRVHPHGAQSTEFQALFTAAPEPTPKFPRLIWPLEAHRIAPRLPELIPTTPGSEFPRVSPVAGFLHPSTLSGSDLPRASPVVGFLSPSTSRPPAESPRARPREVPRLPDLIQTGPGSDFNMASAVTETLPSTSGPPPATSTTLELSRATDQAHLQPGSLLTGPSPNTSTEDIEIGD